MILFAHIGHWYSAFGFLVPAGLVVLWTRRQSRRDRHRREFDELWTLHQIGGEWVLTAITPTPPSPARQRRGRATPTPSPWSQELHSERDRHAGV